MKSEAASKNSALPVIQRGKRFILQKTFEGKQRQVPLGTDRKVANTRAIRFLATAETMGFESALEELKGGRVVKKGDDLDFESMEKIYREYCNQLEEPPREISVKVYLNCLKRIMGDKTLSKVDIEKYKSEYLSDSKDASKKRSLISSIRNAKAVFSKNCMNYYKRRNYTVINPFENVELKAPRIQQYSPLSEKVRNSIWNECEKEEPEIALIVLLGLGLGFRRNEVECARTDWFSIQEDCVVVSVKEESDFIPKSGEKRTFRISLELYQKLLKHRKRILDQYKGKTSLDNDPYFVPVYRRKKTGKRLWKRFKDVSKWLKKMGLDDRLTFHKMRKEAGSIHLQQNKNLLETSKFLGHSDISVTVKHYTGIINPSIVSGII